MEAPVSVKLLFIGLLLFMVFFPNILFTATNRALYSGNVQIWPALSLVFAPVHFLLFQQSLLAAGEG